MLVLQEGIIKLSDKLSPSSQSDRPLVTIGLPVRNGASGIRKAVDSLLAQTYSSIELLIVDNASTDETLAICEGYAQVDKRVQIFRNHDDIGLNKNLKQVVSLASGDYFMLSAHDDYWHPQFIETLLDELRDHPECGGAMSAIEMVSELGDSRMLRFHGKLNPNGAGHTRVLMGVASGTAHHLLIYGLYRREPFQRAFRSFPAIPAGDRVFIGLLALTMKFRYVDEPLYVRTTHSLSLRQRYREDPLSGQAKKPFSRERAVISLVTTVISSDAVPGIRKLLVVPAAIRFFLMNQDRRLRNSSLYGMANGTRGYRMARKIWRAFRGGP